MTDVYFSGAWPGESSGHFLYDMTGYQVYDNRMPADFPCTEYSFDGAFLPPRLPQVEGRATLLHLNGWTILTFWDRSADHRLNSCSAFALRGMFPFAEAVETSKRAFPKVWARFDFEVVEYKP